MNKALTELRREYGKKLERFNEIKLDKEVTIEEVRTLGAELKEMNERIRLAEQDLELAEVEVVDERKAVVTATEVRDLSVEDLDAEYEKTFLRAIRGKDLTKRDHEVYNRVLEVRDAPTVTPHFQSAVGEDGGFIIPHSVSTMIQEYKRGMQFDLTQIVSVFRTSVPSGDFTYEKLSDITPFPNISEWENIEEVPTPQFERKGYKIEDYAGILPIPRQLLQDTDQNLLAYVARYIAKKTLVTRNTAILDKMEEVFTDAIPVEDVDDIKDVLDLELDIAFRETAVFITNQTGYNYLRKMKDADGNYLLQPDVTQPDKYTIDGHQIVVLPNITLAGGTDTAPLYVGDMKEAITFVDRGVYEITPTTIGGHAFVRNSLDIRIIDRFDVVSLDDASVVACEISTSSSPSPSPSPGTSVETP